MNTPYKATDVQTLITEKGFDWQLSKSGKKWELDGNRFDNLKQVVAYVKAEAKRINSTNTVKPESKQGGDAVKFDTSKLVLFTAEIKSPRPSKVKDENASAQLEAVLGNDAYDAVTDMLRDEDGKVYQELKDVQTIRNEWKTFVERYALKFAIGGNRVISVHHRDTLNNFAIEINDKLAKAANAIIAKLDDWKDVATSKGNYIAEKWPSADYFTGYGVRHVFAQLDDSFDYQEEIAASAVEKLRTEVDEAIQAVSEYLSGDKKKFRDNSITNIAEAVGILKEADIVSSDTFNELMDTIEKVSTEMNPAAIREAKEKVDKGVVDPSKRTGRGRKPQAVTKDDIKNCNEYLDTALDPLKELSTQLEGLV